MPAFIGIDIGSTTVTAVAIGTESGLSLASASAQNSAEITSAEDKAAGRSEWDFSRITETAFTAVRSLVDQPGISEIDGIGVTGQQQGCQLFEPGSNSPVGPLISWQDRRATDAVEGHGSYLDQIASLGASHLASSGPKGFSASGCPLVSGYTSALLFWLKSNGLLGPQLKASTVPEFFVSQLTGESPVTDATDAAGWGIFDVVNGRWNSELMRDLGIHESVVPELAPSCSVAGTLGEHMADAMGLSAGIPVSVASGDHQCAFVGAIGDPVNTVAVNVGTGGQCSVFIPDLTSLQATGGWPDHGYLELRPHIQSGYLLAGVGVVGGRSFRTLRDFFALAGAQVFNDDDEPDLIYSKLVELASVSEPGASGLEFRPFFTGTRKEPNRRGEIAGLTPSNFTPGNLARSLFEGMANQLHSSYVEAVDLGASDRTALAGSGNGIRQNRVLNEALEARFGLPMRLSANVDEAAVGAALCASVAVGQFRSISEASKAFVTYER